MSATTVKEAYHFYYRLSGIQLLRPMTLSGTISPIVAGTLFILWRTGNVRVYPFLLLLVGAILIQMATNIWNDYFDFKKGQDKMKWRTNVGNGYHPAHHQLPYIAITLTIAAIFSGILLAISTTFWVIPIGIMGIVGGIYYSAGEPSLSQVGLGELTAAVFLGFTTTLLPFLVQQAAIFPGMFLIAIPFALIISSMILTNNIRDIEKDQAFRRTIAIALGRKKATGLLKLMFVSLYAWMLLLILLHVIPVISIFVFLGVPMVFKILRCFNGNVTNPDCMTFASMHHWIFGLSFSASLLFSSLMIVS